MTKYTFPTVKMPNANVRFRLKKGIWSSHFGWIVYKLQAQRDGEEEVREKEVPGLIQRKPGAWAEGGKQDGLVSDPVRNGLDMDSPLRKIDLGRKRASHLNLDTNI